MGEGKGERLRDLWLPALVALTGSLLSLGTWGLLVAERRDQILATASDTAAETREALQVGLEHQIETLQGLRDLWATFGLRSVEEWEANVRHRIDRVAGLRSVAWVDLDESRTRIAVGEERSPTEVEIDEERARLHAGAPHLEGPDRQASGSALYRVFLPLRTADDHAGVLVGRFTADAFLEAVLRARARG